MRTHEQDPEPPLTATKWRAPFASRALTMMSDNITSSKESRIINWLDTLPPDILTAQEEDPELSPSRRPSVDCFSSDTESTSSMTDHVASVSQADGVTESNTSVSKPGSKIVKGEFDLDKIGIINSKDDDTNLGSLKTPMLAIDDFITDYNIFPCDLKTGVEAALKKLPGQRGKNVSPHSFDTSVQANDVENIAKARSGLARGMEIFEKAVDSRVEGYDHNNVVLKVLDPMLEMACRDLPGFETIDLQSASISDEFVPKWTSPSGALVPIRKRVDYGVYWKPAGPELEAIKQSCKSAKRSSVNHCSVSQLQYNPVILSIEVKSDSGTGSESRAQLAVWASAQVNSIRDLLAKRKAEQEVIVLPLLCVRGSAWYLSVFSSTAKDGKETQTLSKDVLLGNLNTAVNLFSVLGSLRVLLTWAHTTYRKEFMEKAIGLNAGSDAGG